MLQESCSKFQYTICYIYCGVSRVRCTIVTAMIQFKLNELLEARGWTAYRLSQECGVRQDVIGQYRSNTVKRAALAQLNKMCTALKCDIADLMEFVPDKVTPKASTRSKKR